MRTKKKYSGVVIPAITPITENYQLDEAGVENLIEYFHLYKCSPFIAGTTGESASLPIQLKKYYARVAGKLKKPGMQLYAGISSNVLQESIEMANYFFDQGIDVVAATLPSYYSLSPDEMKRYFEVLVEYINGPLIIYNIPATTHMSIPLSVIDELSHHERIVGTKDSERSDERLNESIERWSDREDFSHFLGWAGRSADALINGSDGLIPSTGNLYADLYRRLEDAVDANDKRLARDWQVVSDEVGALYQANRTLGQSLWSLKRLMKEEGICEANVMFPLQPMSKEEETKLLDSWTVYKEQHSITIQR